MIKLSIDNVLDMVWDESKNADMCCDIKLYKDQILYVKHDDNEYNISEIDGYVVMQNIKVNNLQLVNTYNNNIDESNICNVYKYILCIMHNVTRSYVSNTYEISKLNKSKPYCYIMVSSIKN